MVVVTYGQLWFMKVIMKARRGRDAADEVSTRGPGRQGEPKKSHPDLGEKGHHDAKL